MVCPILISSSPAAARAESKITAAKTACAVLARIAPRSGIAEGPQVRPPEAMSGRHRLYGPQLKFSKMVAEIGSRCTFNLRPSPRNVVARLTITARVPASAATAANGTSPWCSCSGRSSRSAFLGSALGAAHGRRVVRDSGRLCERHRLFPGRRRRSSTGCTSCSASPSSWSPPSRAWCISGAAWARSPISSAPTRSCARGARAFEGRMAEVTVNGVAVDTSAWASPARRR